MRPAILVMALLILTACAASAKPTPAPTHAPVPTWTPTAQATVAQAVEPTPVPPLPDDIPTLAVPQLAVDLPAKERLATVLTVQAATRAELLQTAADIQSGTLDGMAGLGRLVGATTALLSIDEALAADYAPPLDTHANAARQIQSGLRDVIGLWMDGNLTGADVPQALVQYDPAAALAALP